MALFVYQKSSLVIDTKDKLDYLYPNFRTGLDCVLSINCLLIIDHNSPLNFALEMLLIPSSGINTVKSNARDLQSIVDEVRDMKSPVVILEDSATPTEENSLAHLLMANPGLKIIVIQKDSNHIHIFRKDEVLIQSAYEFLEIIRSK